MGDDLGDDSHAVVGEGEDAEVLLAHWEVVPDVVVGAELEQIHRGGGQENVKSLLKKLLAELSTLKALTRTALLTVLMLEMMGRSSKRKWRT